MMREIKPDERLRGHVLVEDVVSACGVNSDFWCVRVDDLGKLADLIDPTCHKVIPSEMEGYVFCSNCGAEIGEYGVQNYCHNCWHRVAD